MLFSRGTTSASAREIGALNYGHFRVSRETLASKGLWLCGYLQHCSGGSSYRCGLLPTARNILMAGQQGLRTR